MGKTFNRLQLSQNDILLVTRLLDNHHEFRGVVLMTASPIVPFVPQKVPFASQKVPFAPQLADLLID